MTPEAIIFDNDGVLVDSEAIHVRIEMELLNELGLHYDYTDYVTRYVGLGHSEFLEALAAAYAEAGLGSFPEDFADRLEARAWPRMMAELKPLPNLAPLLDITADRPRAVASSALAHKLRAKLERAGLLEHFAPHVYSAEQVRRSKPAPDLFLFVAGKLAVEPDRCLVIEDSVNGVRAAKAAGMKVIGYTGGGHADPDLGTRLSRAGADACFADHGAIAQQLATRFG